MIATSGLTKTILQTTALAGIDLSIAAGECVAIAGSLEDGRSTLMRIIATLTPPTAGRVVIGGFDAVSDVYRVRGLLAFAGSGRIPANRQRVAEYLRLVAATRRQPSSAADAAAELVGLDGNAPIESLPDRLQQRLPLAAAVASGANLLLLDDVLGALDEVEHSRVIDWLGTARERGTTVVVGARADNVPTICNRILRVQSGCLVELTAAAGERFGTSAELVGA